MWVVAEEGDRNRINREKISWKRDSELKYFKKECTLRVSCDGTNWN